jgi:hypothetical protein
VRVAIVSRFVWWFCRLLLFVCNYYLLQLFPLLKSFAKSIHSLLSEVSVQWQRANGAIVSEWAIMCRDLISRTVPLLPLNILP